MRFVKFLSALIVTTLLIVLFSWHHPFGSQLPPIGQFFSPFTGFWQNAERTALPTSSTITVPGLAGEVEVFFDDRLVPHIFASDVTSAMYAQGYITAKYRLWQMDIGMRQVSGRLSEVLGARTLELDTRQRRMGLVYAAQNALVAIERSPEEKAIFDAYTAGVNAWISALKPKDYPLEFKLLNYKPEAWSALKSALYFKNMAQTLCIGNDDLESTTTRAMLGAELFDFLYPDYNPKQSPIIPAGTNWNFEPLQIAQDTARPAMISERIQHRSLPRPPRFIGSNNWAVSGSKTSEGYPILCNDPHLRLTLPSIWYEMQLHTPQFNTYGVSLPGLPGIIIGFNEYIAWGVTNVGHDVVDWYKITWANDERTRYLLDDAAREVTIRKEEIKVRGKAKPVIEEVKYTVWGPVVYESATSPYQDMAMRWVAHDTPEARDFYDMGTFLRLMAAKGYEDYSIALTGYDSPAQNFVFADKTGAIALKVNGKFPLKKKGQGRFVQDGSYSGNAWKGFIPKSQVPQTYNPQRGFVSSANQHSTDPSYPYYYNGGFDDYRGRYINRRLEQMQQITVQDMMDLQNDNFTIKAEEALPQLLRHLQPTELGKAEQEQLEQLRRWDYRFSKEAMAPVLFEMWFAEAYQRTFEELLQYRDSMSLIYPESWMFIELLTTYPDHILFDDINTQDRQEKASDIVTAAFRKTCADLQEQYPEGIAWAKYKATKIGHLGRINAFDFPFVDVGGYRDAPNAIKSDHGPSWRMVVQLGPEIKAWGVYPGGQSGNPGSKYYDNMIQQWAEGQYNELFFMKDKNDRRQPIRIGWQLRGY